MITLGAVHLSVSSERKREAAKSYIEVCTNLSGPVVAQKFGTLHPNAALSIQGGRAGGGVKIFLLNISFVRHLPDKEKNTKSAPTHSSLFGPMYIFEIEAESQITYLNVNLLITVIACM